MRELDLGWNRFGDAGTAYVATCVHKVKSLLLQDCNITDVGVRVLAQSIRIWDGKVWVKFHL